MRRFLVIVLVALALSGCALAGSDEDAESEAPAVTFRGSVTAESMEPTLSPGDRVIATEVDASGPQIGDVVVYTNPGRWLAGEEGEGQLVHRVIGTPGDTVACCGADGRLSVNGEPIDEPYIGPDPGACDAPIDRWLTRAGSALDGPCRWTIGPVPEDMLFVLGDNRSHAGDSRFHLCPPDESSCVDEPWVPTDLVRGIVELPRVS